MKRAGARISSAIITLCICATSSLSLFAQTSTTGAVEGRVYEEGTAQGVVNATITIENQDTGLTRTSLTDIEGRYFIATLPPGFYRISATAPGFEQGQNAAAINFPITITQTKKVEPPPIALRRVGGVAQTPGITPPVTPPRTTQPPATQPQTTAAPAGGVSDAEQLVNTANAARGGSFTSREILILPLPGVRTFDDLAFLLPGVAPPPQPIGTNVGPGIGPGVGTSGQFAVNGLRSRANNFTIDGSDNNDEEVGVRRQGFTSLVPQPIESVQEFQIITLLPEPQFGRNMGAQVNAVSRSGGTGYHGTVYGFLTDKRLKARDPFDLKGGPAQFPITSGGRPVFFNLEPLVQNNPVNGENPFTRAQYGFVLGGPIIKQKTHFFASFEHQDINASRESHFAVPTVAERGLFGSGGIGLDATPGPGLAPTFPTSISGSTFFSLYPFPNNPLGPYRDNTYTEILPADADGNIFSIKLDHTFRAFGRDHTLTGRYNFTDDNTILPVTGEAIFSTLRALVRTQNFSLILNSPLTTRASNEFRISYGRTSLGFSEVRNSRLLPSRLLPDVPFLLNAPLIVNVTLPNNNISFTSLPGFGLDTETALDAGGIDPILGRTGTGPLGQVKISGFSPVGVDVFSFPQGRTNNTYQFADTVVYDRSRHRLTAGADIRYIQLNSFLDRNSRPLAVFSGAANLNVDAQGNPIPLVDNVPTGAFLFGSDFAAVGAATGFYQTQALVPDTTIGLRYLQNNFFLSDQVRVRPNFTLTLGFRYELNTVPRERDRRIESTFTSPAVQELIDIEKALSQLAIGRAVSGFEQFLAGRKEIYERDDNNFAPHVSFAWDPFGDGRTSVRAGYGIYYDQILGAVVSQSRNVFPSFLTINLAGFGLNPGMAQRLGAFNPAFVATPGTLNTFNSAAFPQGPALFIQAATGLNFATGPGFVLPAADLQTPYAQHWTLTLEREFERNFLLSAGYVGTRGVHLLRFATPNLGPNVIPIVADVLPVSPQNAPNFIFPVFTGFVTPPRRAGEFFRPFPALGSITTIESDANSIYHSLQLQLTKRFSHGIQFTTAYTWSHAIDEVSDLFDTQGATALPQNSFDRSAERADASFDVRQRFVYSLIWNLPFLKQNSVLGGWQFASIGTFQTGQPYSILFCCDANLDGNLTDRVSLQGTTPQAPGQTGRNLFRAPGINTVDLALNKVFRLTERQNIEFRTEVFNVFNRTNFGIPINQIFYGGYTTEPLTDRNNYINTRVAKRIVQFALKYNF